MPRFRAPRETLLIAREESEIQRILSDALATLLPDEIDALPAECTRALAMVASDLPAAAVILLQQDLRHHGDSRGKLLRQLAELHAAASVRLTQI